MIIVITEHGTRYMIDFESSRAKRIPASGNIMLDDGEWFTFVGMHAVDRTESEHYYDDQILTGKSIWFDIVGSPFYDFKLTTRVAEIREIDGQVLSS
jgi:hypothetical protein